MMTAEVAQLWDLAPFIRSAAEYLAGEWPGVFDVEEVTADLSLRLLDAELTDDLSDVPMPRKRRRVFHEADHYAAGVIAEYEHHSGNTFYSVSEVRHILINHLFLTRTSITTQCPDLDEGFRYLRDTDPNQAYSLYYHFVDDRFTQPSHVVAQAITALTVRMNQLNKHRPRNRMKRSMS
jgi:hypothetical protein